MRFCLIVMCGVSAALYGCQDESEKTAVAPASMDMSRSIGADAGSDVGVVSNTPDLNVVDTDASVQMPIDSGDAGAGAVACTPGEIEGCIDIRTQRVCDVSGSRYVAAVCAEGERCNDGDCVPTACTLGELVCLDAQTVGACRRDESGFTAVRTCVEGSPCVNGRCESSCNPAGKIPSNVGCEYWSVDLDNYPDPFSGFPDSIPHVVVVSNTSDLPAMVTVEGPEGVSLVDPEFTVDANDLHVFTFPRLDIDGTGIFDRAFKILSLIHI